MPEDEVLPRAITSPNPVKAQHKMYVVPGEDVSAYDKDSPVVKPDATTSVVTIEELEREIREKPHLYTPWFKMEWERMRSEFWVEILQYLNSH